MIDERDRRREECIPSVIGIEDCISKATSEIKRIDEKNRIE
jgi:hypothetical protein